MEGIDNNISGADGLQIKYEMQEEIQEVERYICENVDLAYKEDFIQCLDNNKPYQRCCIFFNDNRKYRQIHQLMYYLKDILTSIKSGGSPNYNIDDNNGLFDTTKQLLRVVNTNNNNQTNGAVVIYRHRNNTSDTSEQHIRQYTKLTKGIINSIANKNCCCCCSEPSVIE